MVQFIRSHSPISQYLPTRAHTSAAGLFTAIPAVIAYNYFLSRIRRTAFRLDTVTIELMTSLSVPVIKAKPIPVGAQR